MPTMMVAGRHRTSAVMLVQLALLLFMLLPLTAQVLSIEALHLPDRHSQQSHRAPGLTTMSETGLVAITSVMPVSAVDTQDIEPHLRERPLARPVEPPEYPPR